MSTILDETTPLVAELVGLFFISILVTGLIVYSDIKIFDEHIGVEIETCFPTNQETFCQNIRERLGLPFDAQIEIGNSYWEILAIQSIVIPLGFASFRFITIAVRKRKFNSLRIFVVALWFLVPFSLFMFGVIDLFFYVARGMDIPEKLDWLNGVGVFQYSKVLGQDPINVESGDLIFTFTLGILFIIGLFFISMKMYQSSKLKGMV